MSRETDALIVIFYLYRYEGVSSDLNRAKGSIKQKAGRITTLKSHLEEAVSKNHNLANELALKKEKIASLEKRYATAEFVIQSDERLSN